MLKFTKNTRLRMLYLFLTAIPLLIIAGMVSSNTSAQTSSPFPMQGITAVEYASNNTNANPAFPIQTDLGNWVYQWQRQARQGQPNGTNFQTIPPIWNQQSMPTNSEIQTINTGTTSHDFWTVFNECELDSQCNMSPEDMATFFKDTVLGNQNLENQDLIVGGSMSSEEGLNHMKDFVKALSSKGIDKSKIAGWHFHVYPDISPSVPTNSSSGSSYLEPQSDALIDEFKTQVQAIREWADWAKSQGYSGDEIWITEMGCKSCPLDSGINDTFYQQDGTTKTYMLETLEYLNDQAWLNRYAWYSGSWRTGWSQNKFFRSDRFTVPSLEYENGKWHDQPTQELNLMGELYREYLEQDDNSFILDADFNNSNNNSVQNQRTNKARFYFGDGAPEHFVTEYFTGDWDGDGRDDVGTRFNNLLVLDSSAQLDGSRIEIYTYGEDDGSDNYVVGDWDNDGDDDFGIRRGKAFILTPTFGNSSTEIHFEYQNPSEEYLVGDWDGDGDDNLGVRRGKQFILDPVFGNSNQRIVFEYQNLSTEYFVGDWDGDGDDNLGVRRGNQLILDADFNNGNNNNSTGCGDRYNRQICYYGHGNSEKEYLVGDWDGDGDDDFGVRRAP